MHVKHTHKNALQYDTLIRVLMSTVHSLCTYTCTHIQGSSVQDKDLRGQNVTSLQFYTCTSECSIITSDTHVWTWPAHGWTHTHTLKLWSLIQHIGTLHWNTWASTILRSLIYICIWRRWPSALLRAFMSWDFRHQTFHHDGMDTWQTLYPPTTHAAFPLSFTLIRWIQ